MPVLEADCRRASTTANGNVYNQHEPRGANVFIGSTVTARVTVNGADTSIGCLLTGISSSCEDLANTWAVGPGDHISLQIAEAGIGTATRVNYSVELGPKLLN